MIQLVAKVSHLPGIITIENPQASDQMLDIFVERLHGGPAIIQLKKWYKARSTGWKSQSHHLWGHAEQLGEYLGYHKSEMMMIIADMTPSWPRVSYKGKTISASEGAIDSFTASQAIDIAHQLAAENNIILIEEAF